MALLLTIDTSTEKASVCLAADTEILELRENSEQKDHASWLHTAISELLTGAGKKLTGLDAIGVTEGPGSYTGLRVGMASAKGLCFALGKPLITENTLRLMASVASRQPVSISNPSLWLCPMIDARRMEVFTAVYDRNLEEILSPGASILDNQSFSKELQQQRILFFGSGAEKWKTVASNPGIMFTHINFNASDLVPLVLEKFRRRSFADLAYVEPLYLKDFHFSA